MEQLGVINGGEVLPKGRTAQPITPEQQMVVDRHVGLDTQQLNNLQRVIDFHFKNAKTWCNEWEVEVKRLVGDRRSTKLQAKNKRMLASMRVDELKQKKMDEILNELFDVIALMNVKITVMNTEDTGFVFEEAGVVVG